MFVVSRRCGMGSNGALRAGLILAHSGELGLLVVERCLEGSLIPLHLGQPVLGAIAVSMLTGPILTQFSDRIATAFRLLPDVHGFDPGELDVAKTSAALSGHVVLAGCGPVGRLVAVTLEGSAIPYVAIERDVDRLRRARSDGHVAVFAMRRAVAS